jgi:protease-4
MFGFSFLAMFSTPTNYVPERSALCINLNESIVDSPAISPLGSIDPQTMSISTPLTSLQVLPAIESAANDENIEGIYLYLNGTGAIDTALLEELRSAIERFKLSGKFVVAYDDHYTQAEYYLASVADHVILQREGSLEW